MDVVVSRAPGSQTVWNLTDRLGRRVGQIIRPKGDIIAAADSAPDGPLARIAAAQPSLDAAMDEEAKHLKGACQFSSEQEE